MAFVLIRRGIDGGLSLLAATQFASRQEALANLRELAAPHSDDDEYLLVDLDSASPVLFVPRADDEPPDKEVAPPPRELEFVEEAFAEAVTEQYETPLADALRKAAGTLEAEGIVAPESAGLPVEPADEAPAEEAPAVEEPPAVEVPVVDEPPAVEAPEPQSVVEVPAEELDLMTSSDTFVAAAPLAEAELESASEEAVAVVESASQESSEEPGASTEIPAGSDWPWNASAPEAPTDEVTGGQSAPGEPEGTADVQPVIAEVAPDAPSIESVVETASEVPDLPVEPMGVGEPEEPEAPTQGIVPETPTGGYEAGSSDLAQLTCDDCVYLNTCPKHHESDPASCGSFQWRSG